MKLHRIMFTTKGFDSLMNDSGSSKTDTLVKLVLIFFISLLSFSVGTFVGKQFSDSQYKMAQLEGEETERDPAALDPSHLEASPPDALTEEDIASLEEEFAKGKTVDTEKSDHTVSNHAEATAKHHPPSKSNHDVEHGTISKNDASESHSEVKGKTSAMAESTKREIVKNVERIAQIAERVAKGEAAKPETKSETRRVPSSLPKIESGEYAGKYTVQVSAYTDEADAVEHTKALKEKGYSAFYISAQARGSTWYRVNIGNYNSAREAGEYKERIVGGEIKSAIIQKIGH